MAVELEAVGEVVLLERAPTAPIKAVPKQPGLESANRCGFAGTGTGRETSPSVRRPPDRALWRTNMTVTRRAQAIGGGMVLALLADFPLMPASGAPQSTSYSSVDSGLGLLAPGNTLVAAVTPSTVPG
jgi:hypothetical protein